MESVSLELADEFYIEQCDKCLGIFFDPNELEFLLDKSVSPVVEVDRQQLQTLVDEESREFEKAVKYIKCPVCKQIMNRSIFGKKSGVVTDSCRDHGVWLDGGELAQILKWANAGGQVHDAEAKEREEKNAKRKERTEARVRLHDTQGRHTGRFGTHHTHGLGGVLRLLFSLGR